MLGLKTPRLSLTSFAGHLRPSQRTSLAALASGGLPGRWLFVGLCAFEMVASVMLGGGTHPGFLSDAILQLVSIPLLLVALSQLTGKQRSHQGKAVKVALLICFLIVLVPVIQLVSLPPSLWASMPGRKPLTDAFDLLGQAPPWMPVSVSPHATWLGALSLLPAVALFLGVIQLTRRERRMLGLVVLAIGAVSVFLGLLQVAQGPSSGLRFFRVTNLSEAVGFFANRNHFAALIYCLLVLTAAWATEVAFTAGSWEDRKNLQTSSIALLTMGFVGLVVLIAAESMARSRAGLGLTIVALCGAFALGVFDPRNAKGVTPRKMILGATVFAVMFSVQFALYRILERFTADPLDDSRIPFARNTIEAASSYMPFGSGIGTFVPVYAMFEKPQDLYANVFANHAHNDVLELWLETGATGVAILVAFSLWFLLRAARAWWPGRSGGSDLDRNIARAATLIIALLIVHSFFDYPLRTNALMAIFAFACALLVDPLAAEAMAEPAGADLRHEGHRQGSHDKRERAAGPRQPPAMPANPVRESVRLPAEARGRWGEDVPWPDQWREHGDKEKKPQAQERKDPTD